MWKRNLLSALLLLGAGIGGGIATAAPVINEIHFNPPENPVRQEFIEIYNPGPDAVDLNGWRLSSAVNFVFSGPTPLPVGSFVLVSEDPATMSATFGVSALGPWQGKLSSDGETVRLRDTTDAVIDEADYKVGFPWPVTANGGGPSIELINPALDNGLGSSWRASDSEPTPGTANSVFATNTAPAIRKVSHSPKTPTSGEDITISARVTDPDGVASVALQYQLVTPGNYIPSRLPHPIVSRRIPAALTDPETPLIENPDYNDPANWITLSMLDNDGIFSVEIPAQAHRTLLRYRITVEDDLGLTARVPYPDDAALNFACFIYDGVPDYNDHPSSDLTTLPVYQVMITLIGAIATPGIRLSRSIKDKVTPIDISTTGPEPSSIMASSMTISDTVYAGPMVVTKGAENARCVSALTMATTSKPTGKTARPSDKNGAP